MNVGDILQVNQPVPPVEPQAVFHIGSFPVTNSFLFIVLVAVLFTVLGYIVVKRFTTIPGRFQGAVEMLYEGLISLTNSITESRKRSKEIFPVMAALIIYIGVANVLGLVPGIKSLTLGGTPLFRTPMSDFNTTFGLAFALILVLQFVGIREWGLFGYVGRFVKVKELYQGFRKSVSDGLMALTDFFIGLLDIISEAAKVISLSFRLFGNIFAGEVLAAVLLGGIAYLVPSLWMAMSILFGVIQAIVFGSLVAAYYTFSIKPEDEELKEELK